MVDVSTAQVETLEPELVTLPTEAEEWQKVAFQQRWKCLHTIGSLDWKHIRFKKTSNGGSTYHN